MTMWPLAFEIFTRYTVFLLFDFFAFFIFNVYAELSFSPIQKCVGGD